MSYFWPDGYFINVQTDRHGDPIYIVWDWFSDVETVEMIVDFWSVDDDDWWVEPKNRTYYFIVTEQGITAIIFLNALTQDWYIQWVYD